MILPYLTSYLLSSLQQANLLQSMLLMLNEFSLLCHGKSIASYPAAITVYGGPTLYLIVQALALFTFLIWGDSGWKLAVLTRSLHRADDNEKPSLWTPQSYQKCYA